MKKTVLITGATTGIGKATALAFGNKDYNVVFTSRNQARGEEFSKELSDKGVENTHYVGVKHLS